MVEPRSHYLSCFVLRDVALFDDRSFMSVEPSLYFQDEIENLTKCCVFVTQNSNLKREVDAVVYLMFTGPCNIVITAE